MKKYLSTIGLLAMLAAFTGCTTLPNGTTHLDPTRTANAIRAIIPPAVVFAVNKEPAARGYIEKAQVVVCAAASAGQFSPDELKAAIDATGVNEIKTPEVEAAIQAVYGIYRAYYGDVVAQKLNQNEWLIPVLTAICDGLKDGLNEATPTP